MSQKLFDMLQERGFVKDMTHPEQIKNLLTEFILNHLILKVLRKFLKKKSLMHFSQQRVVTIVLN